MAAAANPVSKAPSTHAEADYHCSGKHKRRLLVGEGNFTFALALIKKHDGKAQHDGATSLAQSIIATDLATARNCKDCQEKKLEQAIFMSRLNLSEADEKKSSLPLCEGCQLTAQRIAKLREKGVTIDLEVDGTKIHEKFPGEKFHRIHWNCPHNGSSYQQQTLPPIIAGFFKSCKQVQEKGDRVHMTLAQPKPSQATWDKRPFYQSVEYNIVKAATEAGYRIIKKRAFDSTRYPGYKHTQTRQNKSAEVTGEGLREFVFEKIDKSEWDKIVKEAKDKGKKSVGDFATEIAKNSVKKTTIKRQEFKITEEVRESRAFFECSTDDDSSDYEEI